MAEQGEQLAFIGVDDRLGREEFGTHPRSTAHRLIARFVLQEVRSQRAKTGVAALRTQQAGDAILNHLGQTAGVVAEHRHAAGHRFERSQTETFRPGGQQEEIAGLQDRFRFLLTEDAQVVAYAQFAREVLGLGQVGAVADQHQHSLHPPA